MFSHVQNVQIHDGQWTMNQKNYLSGHDRHMELLQAAAAANAFHSSGQRFDPPKCHPQTRTALLDMLRKWATGVIDSDKLVAWMYGAAGTGKSAIEQSFAELLAIRDSGVAVSTFFFSRNDGSRNHSGAFVATIVYQMVTTTPILLPHIQSALRCDPLLLSKNLDEQVNKLIIEPFRSVLLENGILTRHLIIIDGLDECMDGTRSQLINTILRLVNTFQDHSRIVASFASRPEADIKNAFNYTSISPTLLRIALDDDYRAHDDVRIFFSDSFDYIRKSRPEIRDIESWPTKEQLETLVRKASGQFIYASTVVGFVSSVYHSPQKRLDIVLGLSPPSQGITPFAQLDALYKQILLSVPEDCFEEGLKVITLILTMTSVSSYVNTLVAAQIMGIDESDFRLHVNNYSSIMKLIYFSDSDACSVLILHASLGDFIFDRQRSKGLARDRGAELAFVCRRLLRFLTSPSLDPSSHAQVFRCALSCVVSYIRIIPKAVSVSDDIDIRHVLSEGFFRNLIKMSDTWSDCKMAALIHVLGPIFEFISLSGEDAPELFQLHARITDQILNLLLAELCPWNQKLFTLLCKKEVQCHMQSTYWLSCGMKNLFEVSFGGYVNLSFTSLNRVALSTLGYIQEFFNDPSRCKESNVLKQSEYKALALHCLLRISHGASLPHDDAIQTKRVIPKHPIVLFDLTFKSMDKTPIVPWPQYYGLTDADIDMHDLSHFAICAMRAALVFLPILLKNSPPSVEVIKLCRRPNLKRFPWVVDRKLARAAAKAMADYRRQFTLGRPSRKRPSKPQAPSGPPLPNIPNDPVIQDQFSKLLLSSYDLD